MLYMCCCAADLNYQTDQVQDYAEAYWGPNYNRLRQVRVSRAVQNLGGASGPSSDVHCHIARANPTARAGRMCSAVEP
jgi:hypothetical protein